MKLRFAFIEDYKSIFEVQKLVVNDKVTAVIGKNESGKSNILEILGSINLNSIRDTKVFSKVNRKSNKKFSSVLLEFELSVDELIFLELTKASSILQIEISSAEIEYPIFGRLAYIDYFKLPVFKNNIDIFEELFVDNINKVKELSQRSMLTQSREILKGLKDKIVYDYKSHFAKFKNYFVPNLDIDKKEQFLDVISILELHVSKLYDIFPVFHMLIESDLKTTYVMNEDFFSNKNNSQDTAIMNIINSTASIPDWKNACYANRLYPVGIDAKGKIKKGFLKIQEKFSKFYTQEEIEIIHDIDGTSFSLFVDSSDGMSIPFSERSNGLRWYFGLFLDLEANQLTDKNVIFLIDEPGTSLHVNAQKEVLALFNNLTKDKNQVIYTTHSPFMIDETRVDRIIPIQKSQEGFTKISSSIMSDNLETKSKIETLTPLLEAIGMKLFQNIGLQENVTYILTEGVSDAMYLNVMIKYFDLFNIKAIPTKGASKITDMSFVIWGLGYKFKALFDYDKAGREGHNNLLKAYTIGFEPEKIKDYAEKNLFYVTQAFEEFDSSEVFTIESLIDTQDYTVLNGDYSKGNVTYKGKQKLLLAQLFCDTVINYPETISDTTKNNFQRLINKINEF